MPNIGQTQARNFAFPFPQEQGGVAGGQQQIAGGQAPQMGMEAPNSLQFVREKTKGVYDKYYKLKNFTSSMWKNYKIDVTNPDFSDELSMKANQIYQESIADLKFTADDLQNSQRMLERDASKAGQRLASGYDLQSQPYSQGVGQAFVPQDNITGRTKEILGDYQKQFYDKDTRDTANQNLETYKTQLEQEATTAEQSGRMDLAEIARSDLKAIQGAMYSSEKDDMMNLRYKLAADAKTEKEAKDKIDYTNLWEQWDQVRQGDVRSLEGLQGRYGPVFVPGSINYNYANGKIDGTMKINAKGDTRDVEIDLNDIRGGYLQLLQEHDESYGKIKYDDLLNNTKEFRAKFPELKNATYENDPEFFKSSEYMIGDLTSGGKEGEYSVKTPEGKDTDLKHTTNESQYKASVSRLNEVAQQKGLRLPKGTTKFLGMPDGTVITEVKATNPWFRDSKIRITFENEGMTIDEELDLSDKQDREYIRKLVYSNDVTMNDSVTPNYSRTESNISTTEPKEAELTPAQIQAQELIEKYGGR